MADRGYNPVTNPNPDVSYRRTGVLAAFDGNIRPDVATDLPANVRFQDGDLYGEDKA
jgi:hypothetical protein